jgi:tRNA(Ile)-lysidine synthase
MRMKQYLNQEKRTIKTFEKASRYIKKQELLKSGDRVIAGVSGGADSMCMLLILLSLKQELDLDIIVAHVNHGIRGEEAKRDADFVEAFCADKGLAFELANADIPGIAKETGTTSEEAGRNYRYSFFCELAEKYRAEKIAVAHNSDDNAETVLFNIFRGSGIGGLKGILPKRSISGKGSKYTLIRPVLALSRAEIEEGLKEAGQDFCTDRTNNEDTYARNRLRNTILPMARDNINANVYGHIESLSRQAASVYDFIEQETDKYASCINPVTDEDGSKTGVSIDIPSMEKLHRVLKQSLIRRAFEMVSGKLKDVEETHIEAIEDLINKQSGKRISLPYDITATRVFNSIILSSEGSFETFDNVSDHGITWEICNREDLTTDIPKEQYVKWFDYEKTGDDLEVRTCRDGDYLLIGKEGHKKSLSRFMIDNKIPLQERDKIPLLATGSHVLWVVGYRQDDSCFVTASTKRVLVVKKNK